MTVNRIEEGCVDGVNKRTRFNYKSPDKLTTVTSLKQAMKTISLAQMIDKADDKTTTDTHESAIA